MPVMDAAEKSREVRLRTEAARLGFRLAKDKTRVPRVGRMGGYRLTCGRRVVAGADWNASLDDIEAILAAGRARLTERAQ